MSARTVVISGAAAPLGAFVSKTFAARGDSLALLDVDAPGLDSLTRDLNLPANRLFARAADLTDPATVRDSAEAVLAHFGLVHALIHLVGGWVGGKTIPESSVDDLTFMLNQHAWTTFNLFQSFVPHLIASGWGRVITLSLPLTVHPRP